MPDILREQRGDRYENKNKNEKKMCGTLGRERAESGSLDSGANLRVESEESLPEEMANIAILWNISYLLNFY